MENFKNKGELIKINEFLKHPPPPPQKKLGPVVILNILVSFGFCGVSGSNRRGVFGGQAPSILQKVQFVT